MILGVFVYYYHYSCPVLLNGSWITCDHLSTILIRHEPRNVMYSKFQPIHGDLDGLSTLVVISDRSWIPELTILSPKSNYFLK